MSMTIAVGLIVVAALALLFLIPAIALRVLLGVIGPPRVRPPIATVDRANYVPIEEAPQAWELLRAEP